MSDGSAESAEVVAASAVEEFFRRAAAGHYAGDQIASLIAMTADPETSGAGLRALFPHLIERLNDSFEPSFCHHHDRIMAQVIDFYRRHPEGKRLDAELRSFGLLDESDLLARKGALSAHPAASDAGRVRRIIILSRVTIGADVAVTSVIINHLKSTAPGAEIVWIGPRKLAELYGGDSRIRLRGLDYQRGGRVIDRLHAWLDLREAVKAEMAGLARDEVWIIDPDSRLTQLGMLPLVAGDRNYHYFESRSYRAEGCDRLGHLAARWSEGRFPAQSSGAQPFLALPQQTMALGREITARLRSGVGGEHSSTRTISCLSLGVGGNDLKRGSAEFERQLLPALALDATLIVDRGGTPEESMTIEHLIEPLRAAGKRIIEAREDWSTPADCAGADVLVWKGGIGSFAGLISASDEYIGYDSAGQHLAAALGVPSLTVFVNNSSPLFARRWHPSGPGLIRVLELNRAEALTSRAQDLVSAVQGLRRERRNRE